MSYFRENIDEMAPYVPGEQPRADEKVAKLNTNENPYPPSQRALAVLHDYDGELLRRYPDPMAERFCNTAAGVLGVPEGWIVPGNGSDDLILMISRACLERGRKVVYPVPTFEFYHVQAAIENAEIVEIPFGEDFALPLDDIIRAAGAVTFVARPNSPSGTAAPIEQLDRLAKELPGLLVIDEAYTDFADDDALELVGKNENVVALRTLSKGYSLAGLRLGFAVAQRPVVEGLLKTKAIYNVDALACAVGAAAMEDQRHKNANVEKIKASRKALTDELGELGFHVWPSQANFLLVRPPAGDARAIYQSLKERGILVRYFKGPLLDDKLRITIGTDEQNDALVRALRDSQ